MYARFTAKESVNISIKEASIPIKHYLRQPHRLVKAIADPKLMKQLSNNLYQLKMRPISFMEIYRFQPIVLLKVWTGEDGTLHLKSEGCQIDGIDYINKRFALNLQGILSPKQKQEKTTLEGCANLEVKVEMPTALMLTPKSLLETAGNRLLKSVLVRIKKQLVTQLTEDYTHWSQTQIEQNIQKLTKKNEQWTISSP